MAIVCLYCGYFIKKYILLDGSFVDVGVHSQPCKDIYLFATKKKDKWKKKKNKIPEKGKSFLGSPELYDVKMGSKATERWNDFFNIQSESRP